MKMRNGETNKSPKRHIKKERKKKAQNAIAAEIEQKSTLIHKAQSPHRATITWYSGTLIM
jgi:hypothetical protein